MIKEAMTTEQKQQAKRVELRAQEAIKALAEQDLAAASSLLRIAKIEVTFDPKIETAALQRDNSFGASSFKILLNADFCDLPLIDLQSILLHELLHHVMRHLEIAPLGSDSYVANVVQDAFINQTIHFAAPQLSGLMKNYYDDKLMPQLLLRADSKPPAPHLKVYQALYEGQISESDLYQLLSEQPEQAKVKLIGSHNIQRPAQPLLSAGQALSVMQDIAAASGRRAQGAQAAQSRIRQAVQKLIKVRQQNKDSHLEAAFHSALQEHLSDDQSQVSASDQSRRQPWLQERMARSDMYWMMAGINPSLWQQPSRLSAGQCALYLDISPSMQSTKSTVYGSCLALQDLIHDEVYLFDQTVSTVSLKQLDEGISYESWGTSFDCVAEHFLADPDMSKAVIFTDGEATLSKEWQNKLEASGKSITAAVSPGGTAQHLGFCQAVFELPAKA